MTIKPAVARALRDVRARLRDVAAAEHSLAAEARTRAEAELAAESGRFQSFVDEAPAQLARASSVHELARVATLVDAHRDDVAAAATRHAEKRALAELTTGALRERTRQLKTAERIVEEVARTRDALASRVEQRGNDDLAGRRR